MTKIGVLTFQDGYKRWATDFYPLIKWKKEFKRNGIVIKFFKSHKDEKLHKQDVVIIDHRYYRTLTVHQNVYQDKYFILEFITEAQKNDIKVVLIDNGDGAGGRQWDLIEHVDLFLKKQLLKNKEKYTLNEGRNSYMVFLPEYNLSEKTEKANLKYQKEYTPCPKNQLHKIKLAWNIGMTDYRNFPLSNYYPMGTSRLLNSIYQMPEFNNDLVNKPIDSAFRGKLKRDKENYAYQRNKVIELLKREKDHNYVTGEIISKKKYLKEMEKSKTCVSPFGWGEVCFRDFEAIINGCLLIKPDMDHLKTWPDVYRKNETYISIRWDISDLEETLNQVVQNFGDYKPIIRNAQQVYKEALRDGKEFVNRFIKVLEL